ncbi:hypothetical protein Tco_1032841, partial [Tanacetum coccineum]
NSAFQTEDLDAYDSDCDDLSSAKAVLMANLLSCDPEVLSEVPYSDSYPNDMIHQDVQEMQYSKQTHIDDFQDNEIHNDSNIIPYSQYLQESQDAIIQDTNSSAPNDLLVLSLVEQMIDHVAHLYKENQTIMMYRSTQAMHMLMKPQVFYDDTHKQALGYQNPFHLKKAQRIQPTLYDGSVIAKEHAVIYVFDDEETLILEEESRSKMLDKQNDPISIEKKIKISPIDYSKLNKIKEDFGKRFVTQKELSAEQAFWLKHSSFSETPVTSHTPVRIEAPSELPKDRIKSLSGKDSVENVKKNIDEIETINIKLEHRVAKLLLENENLRKEREHLKSIYKDQFDSIRKTRVQSKEHCDSLIAQINEKSIENSDLNAQLQKKVFAITTLKNEIRKLKVKNVVDTIVSKPNATIAPGMFKLDIEPISHKLKNNRDATI